MTGGVIVAAYCNVGDMGRFDECCDDTLYIEAVRPSTPACPLSTALLVDAYGLPLLFHTDFAAVDDVPLSWGALNVPSELITAGLPKPFRPRGVGGADGLLVEA